MCDSRVCRLIIFVSDFKLDFFDSVEKTLVHFTPSLDYTIYLVRVNDRLKILANANPIKTAFSNKSVGYNSGKNNYKPTSWQGFGSTAEPHLQFKELQTRSNDCFLLLKSSLSLSSNSTVSPLGQNNSN